MWPVGQQNELWGQKAWLQIPALPLASHVAWPSVCYLIMLSVPYMFVTDQWADDSTNFTGHVCTLWPFNKSSACEFFSLKQNRWWWCIHSRSFKVSVPRPALSSLVTTLFILHWLWGHPLLLQEWTQTLSQPPAHSSHRRLERGKLKLFLVKKANITTTKHQNHPLPEFGTLGAAGTKNKGQKND